MARKYVIQFARTFATEANAEKAVQKVLGENHSHEASNLTYSIVPTIVDGKVRFGVLFFGERAVQQGMHHHFNVVS